MGKGVFQLILVEEYSPEKDEVTFCEALVEAAEIVPIMLANQAIKRKERRRVRKCTTIKIYTTGEV